MGIPAPSKNSSVSASHKDVGLGYFYMVVSENGTCLQKLQFNWKHIGLSQNRDTLKSSTWTGIYIMNHPFGGTPFMETPIWMIPWDWKSSTVRRTTVLGICLIDHHVHWDVFREVVLRLHVTYVTSFHQPENPTKTVWLRKRTVSQEPNCSGI